MGRVKCSFWWILQYNTQGSVQMIVLSGVMEAYKLGFMPMRIADVYSGLHCGDLMEEWMC
jgi:hypothetical protein